MRLELLLWDGGGGCGEVFDATADWTPS
jgi:hypothetical protein